MFVISFILFGLRLLEMIACLRHFRAKKFYLVMWLFLSRPIDCFDKLQQEQAFVDAILDLTTKNTYSSQMYNDSIYVEIDLYQLLDIDEKESVVSVKIWLGIYYYLPQLQWDPTSNGPYMVAFATKTVWSPDLIPIDVTKSNLDANNDQFILYDGTVIATATGLNVEFACPLKMRQFPFDTQVGHD